MAELKAPSPRGIGVRAPPVPPPVVKHFIPALLPRPIRSARARRGGRCHETGGSCVADRGAASGPGLDGGGATPDPRGDLDPAARLRSAALKRQLRLPRPPSVVVA